MGSKFAHVCNCDQPPHQVAPSRGWCSLCFPWASWESKHPAVAPGRCKVGPQRGVGLHLLTDR